MRATAIGRKRRLLNKKNEKKRKEVARREEGERVVGMASKPTAAWLISSLVKLDELIAAIGSVWVGARIDWAGTCARALPSPSSLKDTGHQQDDCQHEQQAGYGDANCKLSHGNAKLFLGTNATSLWRLLTWQREMNAKREWRIEWRRRQKAEGRETLKKGNWVLVTLPRI